MRQNKTASDIALTAEPVHGEVMIMGDGVAISMTPRAVLASLDALRQAAETAEGQVDDGAP